MPLKLNGRDVQYILENLTVSAELRRVVEAMNCETDELADKDAKQIGDAATLRLAQVGFGEDYVLTTEGKYLEELVDRCAAG